MKIFSKLRSLFRTRKFDAEMAEEMRLHLEMQTERNVAAGMNVDEARFAALRKFGGVEQIKAIARDQRSWRWLDELTQDVRIGARGLRKEMGFCLAAILVLGLGICGVTTQFTIVNAALFDLLPFPESDQLMTLKLRDPKTTVRFAPNSNIKGSDYREFAEQQQSFTQLAAYMTGNQPVKIGNLRRSPTTGTIEHQLFEVLNVPPLMGRNFTADDDRSGAEPVALISFAWWQADFGSSSEVVGRVISVSDRATTIIGVMPPGFEFPRSEQIWVPMHAIMPDLPREREAWGLSVIGRLKHDQTREQAVAEFATIAAKLASAYPKTNSHLTRAEVVPLSSDLVGPQYRRTLLLMFAAVVLLLVVACINVMNLQFARASRRAHEFSVRAALGATRGRLARQLLTESALLAMLGGAVGIGLSHWCSQLLHAMVTSRARWSEAPPNWATLDVDLKVLAFTVGVTACAVLLSGWLPAWLAARADVSGALKSGGRGATSGKVNQMMRVFVVAQIAITCPLLTGSLLLTRSLLNQQSFDFGFQAAPTLLTGRFNLRSAPQTVEKVLSTLRSAPAFTHVALTTRHPSMLSGDARGRRSYEVENHTYPKDTDRPQATVEAISDGYFATIGLGLLQGRDFTTSEIASGAPVAVVNREFAARNFGKEGAIGRRYRTFSSVNNEPGEWRTIVGVVPVFGEQAPKTTDYAPVGVVFEPLPARASAYTVVARGDSAPESLIAPLNAAFARVYPEAPLFMMNSVRGHLYEDLRETRTTTRLVLAFGAVAALLVTVGLYGVTAFSVRQRAQEFGVRLALGATTGDILGQVLRECGAQLAVGLAIGTTLALVIGAVGVSQISGFLYEVTPFDPLTHATVGALLVSAMVVACAIPAIRAARVDPMVALRCE